MLNLRAHAAGEKVRITPTTEKVNLWNGGYHENNNEDKANSHDDEEGDQVVFQGQAEVRHENQVSARNTGKWTL